ncbi:hypothetical protein AB0B57_18820 [Micromonospora sp. NPDC049101]|uniref:hypothetical protein n=1 Tax=Micromonospora sp. NPDC049101 TaxID=3155032 RepID=UPI003405B34E
MSDFSERINQAAAARHQATAGAAQLLNAFRVANSAAPAEAARRLDRLAADTRDFLTQRGVPPQRVVARKDTTLRGAVLETVTEGWNLRPDFLTVDGHFVRFTSPPRRSGDDILRHKVRPGDRYLGHYYKSKPPRVVEVRTGVDNAVFVGERVPQLSVISEANFGRFYYGDFYDPSFARPPQALLLTDDVSQLYLASPQAYESDYHVQRVDEQVLQSTVLLVDPAAGN